MWFVDCSCMHDGTWWVWLCVYCTSCCRVGWEWLCVVRVCMHTCIAPVCVCRCMCMCVCVCACPCVCACISLSSSSFSPPSSSSPFSLSFTSPSLWSLHFLNFFHSFLFLLSSFLSLFLPPHLSPIFPTQSLANIDIVSETSGHFRDCLCPWIRWALRRKETLSDWYKCVQSLLPGRVQMDNYGSKLVYVKLMYMGCKKISWYDMIGCREEKPVNMEKEHQEAEELESKFNWVVALRSYP